MILITGSSGLIGSCLATRLADQGLQVRLFDIRRSPGEDIRSVDAMRAAVSGVEGIIHLAAISRVVWAECHPQLALAINVGALQMLLRIVSHSTKRPWIIFASSREVYGDQPVLPVSEDASFQPLNVYARTKVNGERLITEATEAGMLVSICRFSNVYGSPEDHADRVITAFARTAASGGELRIEGPQNMFDFTYVVDIADGIASVVEAMQQGEMLPPIHFTSGRGTTLAELAAKAQAAAGNARVVVRETMPRGFDVKQFVGCPERANKLLGWRACTSLETGFGRLVDAMRALELKSLLRSTQLPWLELAMQRVGEINIPDSR